MDEKGRDTKQSQFFEENFNNSMAKGGVFICTHKKLVDVSRRLVQIIIVSLLVSRDYPRRLNEPKIATKGPSGRKNTKLGQGLPWGWIGRVP